jgi:hypothetical protein
MFFTRNVIVMPPKRSNQIGYCGEKEQGGYIKIGIFYKIYQCGIDINGSVCLGYIWSFQAGNNMKILRVRCISLCKR